MTDGVLRERQGYQAQATAEIAGIWGRQQLVAGPVLAVPYSYKTQVIRSRVVNGRKVDVEEVEMTPATAYFLPEALTVAGTVGPETRHRGIYDTVVYSAKLTLAGNFLPDFVVAGIEAEQIDWARSRVLFGLSDLHGIRSVSPLKLGDGPETTFESIDGGAESFLPLAAKAVGVAPSSRLDFSLEAVVQGSGQLEIAPLGKATTVTLQSSWPDPSFMGATLPVSRQVGAGGFKAEWQSSHFSHGFPQSWTTRLIGNREMTGWIAAASFGVRFAQPIDGYGMAERAQKYGVLFFALIFFSRLPGVVGILGDGAGLRYRRRGVHGSGVALLVEFPEGRVADPRDRRRPGSHLRLSVLRAAIAGLRARRRDRRPVCRARARDVLHAGHQLVFARSAGHSQCRGVVEVKSRQPRALFR
jgi:inner membrane protein